ncbi:MAG: hypothetical protein KDC34_04245 [Saprospiraceae bacterium]|nr:hypothetical protein [Saprospiraceae bacterium]
MNAIFSKLLVFGTLLFGIPTTINAQPNTGPDLFELFANPKILDSGDARILFLCRSGQRLDLKGEARQYLFEDWKSGLVLDHSGEMFEVEVKYRLYDGEMILKRGEDLCIIQRPTVQALRFDEKIFVSIPYENERSEEDHGYFELLTDGPIRLLRKYQLRGSRLKECLYLQVDNGLARRYKGGKKSLLKYMGDKQQSMEDYLSSHRINWNNPEDLVMIIDYYHRLGTDG